MTGGLRKSLLGWHYLVLICWRKFLLIELRRFSSSKSPGYCNTGQRYQKISANLSGFPQKCCQCMHRSYVTTLTTRLAYVPFRVFARFHFQLQWAKNSSLATNTSGVAAFFLTPGELINHCEVVHSKIHDGAFVGALKAIFWDQVRWIRCLSQQLPRPLTNVFSLAIGVNHHSLYPETSEERQQGRE